MNRKILLKMSIIVIMMLLTLFLTPKAMAAEIDGNGEHLTSTVTKEGDLYTISVVLPSSNPRENRRNSLTKLDLKYLLEDRYKTGILSKINDINEQEIKDTKTIGTGSVIELSTGRKLTLVLYGDVNGNGVVNEMDALTIQEYNLDLVDKAIDDNYKLQSANLSETGDKTAGKVNDVDSLRIQKYSINEVEKTIVDENLYPESILEFNSYKFLNKAVESINSLNGDFFTGKVYEEKNEVEFSILQSKKLDTFASLIDTLINRIEETKGLEKVNIIVPKLMTEGCDIYTARNLLNNLGSMFELSFLEGRSFDIQLFISDDADLLENENLIEKDGVRYIQYKFSFVGTIETNEE